MVRFMSRCAGTRTLSKKGKESKMINNSLKLALAASAAGIVAVAVAVPVSADDGGKSGKSRGGMHGMHQVSFSDLDADGDGQLTQEELNSAKQVWLSMNDSDGDGSLSKEELQAAITKMMSEAVQNKIDHAFERMDDNGDGLISADEMGGMKGGERRFSRIDSDGDGMISESEFNTAKDKRGKDGRKDRENRK